MRKYLEISKVYLRNNFAFMGDFVLKSLFVIVIMFIFANLWTVIYGGEKIIEGFTIQMMIWYILMAESIITSESPIIKDTNKEIQNGDVAYYLNKPYSYIFYNIAKAYAHIVLAFFITFLLGGLVVYSLVGGISTNPLNIIFIIISLFLAVTLNMIISLFIGMLGFWFEDTVSLRFIYHKLLFTLGGMLMPLEIFPIWLSKIAAVLPFSFVAYFPSKLFVSFNFELFIRTTLIQIGYIGIFGILLYIVYKKASRGLNINGG